MPICSQQWTLKRLKFDEEYNLLDGKTKIGGALDNDIVIKSKYCSEYQCTIDISDDGTITLTNLVRFNSLLTNAIRILDLIRLFYYDECDFIVKCWH